MHDQWDILGPAGLRHYGQTCASVSHELKNSLALINENAGLLGDLLARARQGHPLDPEKMALISERIAKHVGNANATIAGLNRFAHLIDTPVGSVDVNEAVALAVRLHLRLASQKRVELIHTPGAGELTLSTRPFELGNALGVCIKAAVDAPAAETITVEVAPEDQGVAISLYKISPETIVSPQGEETTALLNTLDAQCRIDTTKGALVLSLRPLAQD